MNPNTILIASGIVVLKKSFFFLGTVKPYTDKVTDFTGTDIGQLKKDFRQATNEIADKMTEEEKNAFIEESNQVFVLNNSIVNSVGGQDKVFYNLMYKGFAIFLIGTGIVLAYLMHK